MSDKLQTCVKCERPSPINYNRAGIPVLCLDCALEFLEDISKNFPTTYQQFLRGWLRA